MAGGTWRSAGGAGRRGADAERQLRLQPVDERPFAAGGLYGIGGQPGAAGHRRADGRAARRAAGDCHRPASGRSEERPGVRPRGLQGVAERRAGDRPEDRGVGDRRGPRAQPHQFPGRFRRALRQPVRAPRGDPRERPGELRRNPQGRRLRPSAWRAEPGRAGLFRRRRRVDRRLRRAQRPGVAVFRRRTARRTGRGTARLRQHRQPAGLHHRHLGRCRGPGGNARQRFAQPCRRRPAGARLSGRGNRRAAAVRPASATLLRRAEAPRQSRLHRLGVPGTAAGSGPRAVARRGRRRAARRRGWSRRLGADRPLPPAPRGAAGAR
ncbi:Uncharacterised protein [Pseudomonas aeruginosa]|nr:Uncharacterised protein [Pseudomonas aeruginosa]